MVVPRSLTAVCVTDTAGGTLAVMRCAGDF